MKNRFIKLCSCLFVVLLILSIGTVAFAENNGTLVTDKVIDDFPTANNSDYVQSSSSSEILSDSNVIGDGVYAFRSFLASSRWMTVEDGSIYQNAKMQHELQSTVPTDSFNRANLFKISRVQASGTYIIRSMLNNRISFEVIDSSVVTKVIPAADADVSIADTFYIEAHDGGYVIRPYGSTKVVSVVSLGSLDLSAFEKASNLTGSKWELVKYSGMNRADVTIYRPSNWSSEGITVGEVQSASIVGWSTYINVNVLQMELSSDSEDVADAVWDPLTDTLTITAIKLGQIRINSYLKHAVTNTPVINGYNLYYIVPKEGVYYIQNADAKKYVSVANASTSYGALIQAWSFDDGNQQQWRIEHVPESNGYVRIKSLCSNMYLGVTASNTSIIRQISVLNDYTLWRVEQTTSSHVTLINKATETAGYALSLPSSNASDGTNLTQTAYADDSSYCDEWTLYCITSKMIDVEVVYDHAYDNRYTDADTRLENKMVRIRERYLTEFGVWINFSEPTLFTSYADENCSMSPDEVCDHATDEDCENSFYWVYTSGRIEMDYRDYHHNNIYNIMLRIEYPTVDASYKIAFTGHRTCKEIPEPTDDNPNPVHSYNPYYGLTYPRINLCIVTNFGAENQETKTTMHELNHNFGAEDHYGQQGPSSDDLNAKYNVDGLFNSNCIHGENKDGAEVAENLVLCDGCRMLIQADLNSIAYSEGGN